MLIDSYGASVISAVNCANGSNSGIPCHEVQVLPFAATSTGRKPYAVLHAADEKSRRGARVPLRRDLAAELAQWIAESGHVPSTPLFHAPAGLVRFLDRDLAVAGIPKRDERGRTVDVHALRTTFGTLLSKGGVAPRTAQAAMRHASIDLTMTVYTDPKLLDVYGALGALPELRLDGTPARVAGAVRATGTDDSAPRALAPLLAPTPADSRTQETFPDRMTAHAERANGDAKLAVTHAQDVSRRDESGRGVRMPEVGLEPTHPCGHQILNLARLPVPPLRPGWETPHCRELECSDKGARGTSRSARRVRPLRDPPTGAGRAAARAVRSR